MKDEKQLVLMESPQRVINYVEEISLRPSPSHRKDQRDQNPELQAVVFTIFKKGDGGVRKLPGI